MISSTTNIKNYGTAWIVHGENIISFSTPHNNNDYIFVAQFTSENNISESTRSPIANVFTTNIDNTKGKVRINTGYGYTMGGYTNTAVAHIYKYDDIACIQSDINQDINAGTGLYEGGGFNINGYIFFTGGYYQITTTFRFDTITQVAPLSMAALSVGVCATAGGSANSYGYLFGGSTAANDASLSTLAVRYDHIANVWISMTTYPTNKTWTGVSTIGDMAVMPGGGEVSYSDKITTIRLYDSISNSYPSCSTNLITGKMRAATTTINGYNLSSGADTGSSVGVDRFDLISSTCDSFGNLNTARTNGGAEMYTSNGYGYIIGGYNVTSTERLDDVTRTCTSAISLGTTLSYMVCASNSSYWITYFTIEKSNKIERIQSNNTTLLLHGNSFIDSSIYKNIITKTNVTISGNSLYFNGSAYLKVNNSSPLIFSTNDFTIDFWIYFTSSTGYQSIFSKGYTAAGAYVLQTNTGDTNFLWYEAGTLKLTTAAIGTSTWAHVALVRSGTTVAAYINGTSSGTPYTTSFNYNNTSDLYIGEDATNYKISGYIKNFRISNIAQWTTNFTPSTQPYIY